MNNDLSALSRAKGIPELLRISTNDNTCIRLYIVNLSAIWIVQTPE